HEPALAASTAEISASQIVDFTANMLINGGKTEEEVIQMLREGGLPESDAQNLVMQLSEQISSAKKQRAQKDMLYGALWCVGGIAATAAHIGFIFWGAIVFGAIQFIKGVINL
ncbi:MAG: hypothetical protein RLY16_3002, partial [Bacteroidota bacterium]